MFTIKSIEKVKAQLVEYDFVEADFDGETVKIIEYDDFVKLVQKFGGIVFYNIIEIEESDIKDMCLEDRQLAGLPKEYLESIVDDIADYHLRIVEKEELIGSLLRLELFITTPLGIFSYTEENSEVFSLDAEDFLQELMDRDELVLETYRNKEEVDRRKRLKEANEVVIAKVLADPKFLRRTNKDLRFKYGVDHYFENVEEYTGLGLSRHHMQDIMEEAWLRTK